MSREPTRCSASARQTREPGANARRLMGRISRHALASGFFLAAGLVSLLAAPAFPQTPAQSPALFEGVAQPRVAAQPRETATTTEPREVPTVEELTASPAKYLSPESLPSSMSMMVLVSVLSLAPAVLLMTTSFVRMIIVFTLLRQALGVPQAPPNQVLTSIALFLTLVVMTPVWQASYREGVAPYLEKRATAEEAWQAGVRPVREFMILQIERTGNSDDLWLFLEYSPGAEQPQTYADVPLTALLPAYLLSEIKTAFLIGFQIYLPFLILDLVVASVLTSLGLMMVPPAAVSLPFKLMLFVLIDGWRLVAGMLLESFARFG